jgi:hypothetical protein
MARPIIDEHHATGIHPETRARQSEKAVLGFLHPFFMR